MSKDKIEPIDVFAEGKMQEAMKSSIEENAAPILTEESKVNLIKAIEERSIAMQKEGTTQWDILQKMIEGDFTERFINELQAMPGKDFVKNYLKMLEHFKPKLTRQDKGEAERPDLTINIQTMIINPDTGEQEVVDITDLQNYKEDES